MTIRNKRIIDHKRGNVFSFNINLTSNDEAVVIDVEHIKCQLKNENNELISTCVVTSNGSGSYTLKVSDTYSWPLSKLMFDIAITISGQTTISDIYEFQVIQNITSPS